MKALIAALLLAGCAAPVAQHHAPLVAPEALQTCPAGARAPLPPKPPRSVAALLGYAVEADRARAETATALAECADRLNRLNNWILEQGR